MESTYQENIFKKSKKIDISLKHVDCINIIIEKYES